VKVFISWSGEQSRQVALALRNWLPQALQAVRPYMSEKDTEAGGLWDQILGTQLEASDFGIVCLTPGNLDSRWLNFEAGALSKAMTDARVVPVLFRLKDADVGPPLSRFQMKTATREGILDTVKAINAHAEPDRKIDESALIGTFESLWPKLEAELHAVSDGQEPRTRSSQELLEEVLQLVRELTRDNIAHINPTVSYLDEALSSNIIKRVKSVAGARASVGVDPEAKVITIWSPRFGGSMPEIDSNDSEFLFSARENLLMDYGVRLKLIGRDGEKFV
jgi:TIR domain